MSFFSPPPPPQICLARDIDENSFICFHILISLFTVLHQRRASHSLIDFKQKTKKNAFFLCKTFIKGYAIHFKNYFLQMTDKLAFKKFFSCFQNLKSFFVCYHIAYKFVWEYYEVYLTVKNIFREQNAKFRSELSFWQHTFDKTKFELKKRL